MAGQSAYHSFAVVYDRLMKDIPYSRWVDFILEKTQIGEDAFIADAACGTGNITLALAEKGYKVVGLDSSEQMLAIAAEKARRQGVQPVFVRQELCELALHKKADCVLCVCDGVNYLTTPQELELFFTKAHQTLKDGGTLLFDISSAYKLERVIGNNLYYEDLDEITYFWQNEFDRQSGCLNMELVFFIRQNEFYKRFDETHVQKAHTIPIIKNILQQCGFSDIQTYDDYSNNSVTDKSLRITFTAKR